MDVCLAGNILGKKPVVEERQHGYPRSTGDSTVEDRYLTVFSQPQSEVVVCLSPHVIEEGIAQELLDERLVSQQSEQTSPQHPVRTSSQEETEPLN